MRRALLVLAWLLLAPGVAGAEWHLYIVPAIGEGTPRDAFRPKYIDAAAVPYGAVIYGRQGVYLVAADVSDAQDAALQAQSDVRKVPDNLDATLSPAGVTATQAFLETLNIPAGWVNTSLTWRQIVRTVGGLFLFTQRYVGTRLGPERLIDGTITLDTRFNQLPQNVRQALLEAATSLNFDTSSLSGASTLRQILKAMADQWGARPIKLGTFTL